MTQPSHSPKSDSGTIGNFQFSILHFKFLLPLAFCLLPFAFCLAAPLGTAFSYQGRLNDGSGPATGIYDFRFAIYDLASGGSPLVPGVTNAATPVVNGLFTAPLDFGAGAFDGSARWLAIEVRTNGAGAFTPLLPRQLLTPSPYALYAPSAGTAQTATTAGTASMANATAANAVNTASLQANSITTDKIADGTIRDADISPSGITGDKIIGGDLQARRLKVGQDHTLTGDLATIAGGLQNSATGTVAAVGGGIHNLAAAEASTVGGGSWNTAAGVAATVGGGYLNVTSNSWATVSGGGNNQASGWAATIGGGANNQAIAANATVGGGDHNLNAGGSSFIGGGSWNTIASNTWFATIPGGWSNEVTASLSLAAGSRAKNRHYGSFLWADGTEEDFLSENQQEFAVRARGGVRFDLGAAGFTVNGGGGLTVNGLKWGGASLSQDQGGVMELGDSLRTNTTPFVDFHYGVTTNQDFNVRLINSGPNEFQIQDSSWGPLLKLNPEDAWVRSDWTTFFTYDWRPKFSLGNDGSVFVDPDNRNTNGITPGLRFGWGSGEGIASKRSEGGNQWGLDFYTGWQPRMSIAYSGDVLIAPAGGGNLGMSAALKFGGSGADNTDPLWIGRYNAAGNQSELRVNVGDDYGPAAGSTPDAFVVGVTDYTDQLWKPILSVLSIGNMGIGTTAPLSRLHVQGSGDTEVSIQSSDATGRRWTLQASGDNPGQGRFEIIDRNVPASRMTILTNGDVGIGTTAPAAKLEVMGGPIKATGGFILELRSNDPPSPVTGQMWLIVP